MSNSITTFKTSFNGGTRANRFIVRPVWPSGVQYTPTDSTFKMVSTTLPTATINTITVPYRGRMINFAGDRMYNPWSVGVYDDGNSQNLWQAFQKWKELLDGHYNHLVANNDYAYTTLQTTWTVEQLDINNSKVLRRIILYKCWPSVIGEFSLNMGENTFVSFPVTLTFDYFTIQTPSNNAPTNNAQ